MEQDALITVIMPVYNAERYLARAIESVLAQTYKKFELILIDDGSTDNSPAICDRYARTDNRICVCHIPNGGVSAARNKGLELAKGKYIQFIDADDQYCLQRTERFVSVMQKGDYDFVIAGLQFDYGDRIKSVEMCDGEMSVTGLFMSYTETSFATECLLSSVCSGFYKREIIERECLRFSVCRIAWEDSLFTLQYLEKCLRVYCLKEILYVCERGEENNSTIRRWFYWDQYKDWLFCCSAIYRIIGANSVTIKKKKALAQLFLDRLIRYLIYFGCYMPYLTSSEIDARLYEVVSNKFVCENIKYYRKTRRQDSSLIPLLINLKWVRVLRIILKYRGQKYYRQRERSGINCLFHSVFRDIQ